MMRKISTLFWHSPWVSAAAFLLLIAALKWPAAVQAPVWDESVSIFPAANYLATHHFNVVGLLREPGYGAHWLSLMSFVTAAVLTPLGGGSAAWVVLHLVQWCLGAVAGAIVLGLLAPLTGRSAALWATLLFLLAPVTLAQFGCMYVEIPLVLFSVAAVAAYLAGRAKTALLLCALACFTKESGIVVAVTLALAAFLEAEKWTAGVRRGMGYLAAGSVVVLGSVCRAGYVEPLSADGPALAQRIHGAFSHVLYTLDMFRLYAPDHLLLLALGVPAALCVLWRYLCGRRDLRPLLDPSRRLALLSALFLPAFAGLFFVVMPLAWDKPHYLPRYLVQALPFIIALVVLGIKPFFLPRVLGGILALFTLLALANRHGVFYRPIPFNSISFSERSEESADGYAMTRAALTAVEREVPPQLPIVLGPFTHALTQQPYLGYVSKPLPNALNVLDTTFCATPASVPPPDHFFLLHDYPWHGGDRMLALINRCRDPQYPWKIRSEKVFTNGHFNAYLVEIAR